MHLTTTTSNRTAAAWIAGGTLWVIAGLVDGGSIEPIWIAADLLLLVGLTGLLAEARDGRTPRAALGLRLAIAARFAFIAGELIAASAGNDENVLLPIGALLTAIGMIVYAVRAGVRAHLAPLAMGIYPFLVMFPYVATHDGDPSIIAITLWGIPTALVGVSLLSPARHTGVDVPERNENATSSHPNRRS